MLIILVSYLVLIWLVFSKFKLIRLTWSSGTVAALAGIVILAVFVAMLNYLTPPPGASWSYLAWWKGRRTSVVR